MKPPELEFSISPRAAGYGVMVNGKPVHTPGGHELVVPSRALARAIMAELEEDPARIAGKGFNDPAVAPFFRLAAGALDVISDEAGRKTVIADLIAYGETDMVLFRSDGDPALQAREAALWSPLLQWFGDRYGVSPKTTAGLAAVPQDDAVRAALVEAIGGLDAMRLGALALATRTAGSIFIGLALVEGFIDADDAHEAAVLEESYQAAKWGEDAEAAKAREGKHLDLVHAAGFLGLVKQD